MHNPRTETEMWDHRPLPRHRRDNPSFSSSLLDAIYRSIDEESDSAGNLTGGTQDPAPRKPRAVPVRGSPLTPLHYHSSSSSSSEADSARTARPKPARSTPVLTRSHRIRFDPPPPNPNANPNPNPNPTKDPITIKKKVRDLKKSSTSPSSPGAKLAGFLNSLFTPSNHKKAKISTAESSSSPSSASSYARSCLSKTPSSHRSTGSKRSVRFSPVGVIVGEDCRPCGEKFVFGGEAAAAERRRRSVVEELMRGFEMEAESGDESDDGSEDLFELENLAGISGVGGREFSDELPVYGTTDLGMNRAIAKGLVV